MVITNRDKFRKLFADDNTHYVSLMTADGQGQDVGYMNSPLEVQAAVLNFAYSRGVNRVTATFGRNVMADPDVILVFHVSYDVKIED
ncbi:hypothetical protein pEaSNUABM5_00309 [Erwinia phage pEa_SNUABM_5]|uniref:Uncharacterized protein n=1 Tax=Erwinia phage pEa_SNUABM_5 TaxID=2797313 RepID=A0A7T8IVU7_9CAUD|nr:hypothetical protein MPK73_gp309 [Erwinia phage pEa_SNUABM_5]QQO90451.1 hypothetical protein pEaSNUABM5_00309 [Erwinia phage pEa_SNUABM_5]